MNTRPVRFFKLSPPGKRHGISCDVGGAFIDSVPLLKKTRANGKDKWEPRDCGDVSADLSAHYGLPIDVSSKAAGLAAVARALSEGSIARAQLTALFLRFPESPPLEKNAASRSKWVKFIQELYSGRLLKIIWVPEEHPRWPAGMPESQGGRFAPKGQGGDEFAFEKPTGSRDAAPSTANGLIEIAANTRNGAMCRDIAVAGCIATSAAATPEGAGAACAASGPACPAGAAVGGAVTAIGSCLVGGIAAYEACEGTNSPSGIANPPTDEGYRKALAQCREECATQFGDGTLSGPRGIRGSDSPSHMRRCIRQCMHEQGYDDY